MESWKAGSYRATIASSNVARWRRMPSVAGATSGRLTDPPIDVVTRTSGDRVGRAFALVGRSRVPGRKARQTTTADIHRDHDQRDRPQRRSKKRQPQVQMISR